MNAEFKPTPSQEAAIYTENGAVLVSAGAGSGKTKVLTERLMRYLRETDAGIEDFLVITFTKAAAAELMSRIKQEIQETLEKDVLPDELKEKLRRESAKTANAKIGTIHSFCTDILRENCQTADLPAGFKVADEERAETIRKTVADKVLEEYYLNIENDKGFKTLADNIGRGTDDSALTETLLDLHAKMQSHARPTKWLEQQKRLLTDSARAKDPGETPWGEELLKAVSRKAHFWAGEFDKLISLMQTDAAAASAYTASFSETAEGLRALVRATETTGDRWEKTAKALDVNFPTLGRIRGEYDEVLKKHLQARRKKCKDELKTLAENFSTDPEGILRQISETAPALEALVRLTEDFDAAFIAEKRRQGLIDYSDMEHVAARILTNEDGTPTETALGISERFREIMVDEYQDISDVQETIFNAVSENNGRNLFAVGDVKQSIYRFRLANPAIFTKKYKEYSSDPNSAYRKIFLKENYRSRKEIIAAVNSVFRSCMSEEAGEINYDSDAELRYSAAYDETGDNLKRVSLSIYEIPETPDGEEKTDCTKYEAECVAKKIKQLVSDKITVMGKNGPKELGYGEIAILLRSANSVGPVYRRALSKYGIPVASGQGEDYYASIEISSLVSILSVIDNPHRDIPLVAVLTSPVFGFTSDELAEIRSEDKGKDIYTCLNASENGKCKSFTETLEYFRKTASDMPVGDLLFHIYNRLDVIAIFSAMPGGAERRGNLLELLKLADDFEKAGYKGLHKFVERLRRNAASAKNPVSKAAAGGAVQIMTIHKSKGLEFPVVFLSDLCRKFNTNDEKKRVLIHPELGLGSKLTDNARGIEYPTLAYNAIKYRLNREMKSEEMRLAYVAMTRAKEYLFMTAAPKSFPDLNEEVSSPIEPETLLTAAAPFDWYLKAALADNGKTVELVPVRADRSADTERKEKENKEKPEEITADEGLISEIERRLSFIYPHKEAQELPSKITATALKGRRTEDEDSIQIGTDSSGQSFPEPDFVKDTAKISASERGTATHLLLQHMDISAFSGREYTDKEAERLLTEGVMSEREYRAADRRLITDFLSSETGIRLREAEKIIREFKFSILMKAAELFDTEEDDEILLQGVADCFFEEKDGIVVLDYKTDAVFTDEEIRNRAEHYRAQILAYSAALERITGKRVKEKILCFLRPRKNITIL